MRIVVVDAHQPGLVSRTFRLDEVDGPRRAPGLAVQLRRELRHVCAERAQVLPLRLNPLAPGVADGPVVARRVAPLEDAIAVIHRSRLKPTKATSQVKLACQAAVVAGIRQQLADERGALAPDGVAIAGAVHRGGIAPGQKAGAAGRADRALAKGVVEGRAFMDESVDVGRADATRYPAQQWCPNAAGRCRSTICSVACPVPFGLHRL